MCAVYIIALVALFLGASPPRATARAIQRECPAVMGIINGIAGCFLQDCQENGGLPVVGYPLTPARREQLAEGAFVAQGFERNRFASGQHSARRRATGTSGCGHAAPIGAGLAALPQRRRSR